MSRTITSPRSKLAPLALGLGLAVANVVMAVQHQTAMSASVPNVYTFRYLLYLPAGYNADPSVSWPLMVFLHGAGERGTDVERVAVNGPPMQIEQGRDFPCVVVSPLCSGSWWVAADLQAFIEDLVGRYRIDADRVYLTGLSMGGYGTWELAERRPDFYAAIAPICGAGDTSQAYKLRDLPVWAFHGALDTTVPVMGTLGMIQAIQQAEGDPYYTIYPNLGHDAWTTTYGNGSVYTWLFDQSRENVSARPPAVLPAPYVPATPTTPTTPATTVTPPAPAPSGGGGGAISGWFIAALALLGFTRRIRRKG